MTHKAERSTQYGDICTMQMQPTFKSLDTPSASMSVHCSQELDFILVLGGHRRQSGHDGR